ncbi:putative peptide-methionine (R)-S-oxide reductase [Dioscorea sansibarensis]
MGFHQLLRSCASRPHYCDHPLLQSLIPQSLPSQNLVQVRRQTLRIPSINPQQFHSKTLSIPISLPSRRVVVAMASSGSVQKSEEEWRAILSPEQFRILRQKGTEYPGTGEYDKFFGEGIYECAGCGTPLYRSTTKFNSGCGWPAFFEGVPGAITRTPDPDGRRTEITCTACGGHLGHVFKGEGFNTPTDERHCVNSISIKFKAASN